MALCRAVAWCAVAEDIGAKVGDWLDLVRRARLGSTVKLVAFYLAGRAANDGTKVFPGIARAAIECEVSSAVVRRALKTLRDAQLIEVTRRGNRRAGKADEYRLTIGVDVLELIDVPNPDEHHGAILAVRDRERETQQRRQARMAHRRRAATTLTQESDETGQTDSVATLSGGPHEPVSTLIQESVEAVNNAHFSTEQRSPERASNSHGNSPVEATPLSDGGKVRTDLTVTRARGPSPEEKSDDDNNAHPDARPAVPDAPLTGCGKCIRGFVLTAGELSYCECHPNHTRTDNAHPDAVPAEPSTPDPAPEDPALTTTPAATTTTRRTP